MLQVVGRVEGSDDMLVQVDIKTLAILMILWGKAGKATVHDMLKEKFPEMKVSSVIDFADKQFELYSSADKAVYNELKARRY